VCGPCSESKARKRRDSTVVTATLWFDNMKSPTLPALTWSHLIRAVGMLASAAMLSCGEEEMDGWRGGGEEGLERPSKTHIR